MKYHLHSSSRQFGFNVADQELFRMAQVFKEGIHVGKREPPYPQVRVRSR
jgi:hypothetical protein